MSFLWRLEGWMSVIDRNERETEREREREREREQICKPFCHQYNKIHIIHLKSIVKLILQINETV